MTTIYYYFFTNVVKTYKEHTFIKISLIILLKLSCLKLVVFFPILLDIFKIFSFGANDLRPTLLLSLLTEMYISIMLFIITGSTKQSTVLKKMFG